MVFFDTLTMFDTFTNLAKSWSQILPGSDPWRFDSEVNSAGETVTGPVKDAGAAVTGF